jgi:hypothetical protein
MERIYYWWSRNFRYYTQGIRNLIKWFPIIWKDRDWDDHYIWEIWKFKLRNQAKYIGDKDRHVNAKRDAEIMLLCARLMDRIQDEYYQCEYQQYHTSEMIFKDSDHCADCKEIDIIETSEHFDDYFAKYPLIYRTVPDLQAPKFEMALHIARINGERAKKILFTLLERNILRWWD